MNEKFRFYVLLGIVVLVIGGLLYLVRGNNKAGAPPEGQTAAQKAVPNERDTLEAPEIASSRRESRLTVTASHASGPRESDQRKRTGTAAIRGEVTMEDDNVPVGGVEISIVWTDLNAVVPVYDDALIWKATTNERGLFRVDKLPDGRFIIFARKDDLGGIASVAIRPLLRETEDHAVDIRLAPVGGISGQVVDAQLQPVTGALVALGRGKSGERDIYGGDNQTKSGSDGRFTLDCVRKGEWTIECKAEGYAVSQTDKVPVDGQPVQIVLKKGGSVSGVVVAAETSKPLPNVKVRFRGQGRLNSGEVATDGDGNFEVNDLADGRYALSIEKQAFVLSGQSPSITIENANTIEDLKMVVAIGGIVSGRATDAETGAPIANMGFRPMSADGRGSLAIEAATDEDGFYRIEGLPAGSYKIRRMWMAGYRHGEDREDKSVTVALGQEVTGIDFAVPPGLYLRGRVVDRNGDPLSNVVVQSQDEKNEEGETMQTDEKGRWVHRGFSPGTVVRITAEKPGFSAKPLEKITIPDHDLNDIEIVMDTGASIAGIVVDKTGKPLPNVYVVAAPSEPGSGDQAHEAYSHEEGVFKVQGLAAGKYKLSARPPRSYRQRNDGKTEVEVSLGQQLTGVRLVADFDAGVKLAGRVVDSTNKPVRDANVSVRKRDGGSDGYAQSDTDGKFEISGLETGAHDLYVYHNDYSQYRQEQVEVPNSNLNITLRGKGTLQGRVLDSRSGRPVKTFSISVITGDVGRIEPGGFWGSGQTFVDDEGKFEVRGGEGVITLIVTAQGYAPTLYKVTDIAQGQTKSGISIRMDLGGSVDGTVTNTQGAKVAGASIWVGRIPQDWERGQRSANATTDEDGSFHVDSLPAETIRLYAIHADYATGSATASPTSGGTATVKIVLGSGGTINGTVRVGGKPATGYGVSIYYPRTEGGYNANKSVDDKGRFTFTGLPEGEAQLNVYGNLPGPSATRRQLQKTATVMANQVTTVDFDIVEGTAAIEGIVMRDGQPVSDAYINVSVRTDDGDRENAGNQTDAKGAYSLQGLPPGTATLSVHVRDSNQSRSFQTRLEDRQTTKLDVELNAGVRVAGRINGIPPSWRTQVAIFRGEVQVADDMQTMWSTYQEQYAGGGMVNDDGTFQIDGQEPGEYTVIAVAFDPQSQRGEIYKIASQAITVSENGAPAVELTIR